MKKAFILCIFAALAFGCRPMDTPAPPKEQPQDKTDETDKPDDPGKPDSPDVTDPFESAAEAVLNMGAGWNLGNTLDTNSGDTNNMWIEAWTSRTPKDYETSWGQPETTRELIHMFKEAGFGVIRVPVTWYPHMGTITLHDQNKWNPATWTGTTVDPQWMARVKEVVDYVINEGMYCILNVHHDTGSAPTAWIRASEDGFNAAKDRYEVLWQQIAITFKDYGEKLLFESYNEMLDQYDSWCFASFAAPGNYDADVARGAYNAIYSYGMLRLTYKLNIFGGKNANGTSNERNMWGGFPGGGFGGGRPGGGGAPPAGGPGGGPGGRR
jgi:aryl-phospho-beta-D-glucosidase BglC (GH1 family)